MHFKLFLTFRFYCCVWLFKILNSNSCQFKLFVVVNYKLFSFGFSDHEVWVCEFLKKKVDLICHDKVARTNVQSCYKFLSESISFLRFNFLLISIFFIRWFIVCLDFKFLIHWFQIISLVSELINTFLDLPVSNLISFKFKHHLIICFSCFDFLSFNFSILVSILFVGF